VRPKSGLIPPIGSASRLRYFLCGSEQQPQAVVMPPGSSTDMLVWLDFLTPAPLQQPDPSMRGLANQDEPMSILALAADACDMLLISLAIKSPAALRCEVTEPWTQFQSAGSASDGATHNESGHPQTVANAPIRSQTCERVSETNRNSSEVSTLFHDPCSSVVGRAHYCTATDASSQAYLGRV
jgi:hypothetical protein